MRTLEEAIEYVEEVAKANESLVSNYENDKIRAKIHRQLAAWLKELKDRQKMPEVIRCSECAFCRPFLSDKVCSLGLLHNINSDMDFCSRAVRRTDEVRTP